MSAVSIGHQLVLQVDPYDYDRIVVILKLIKELSYGECTATVEKVKGNVQASQP